MPNRNWRDCCSTLDAAVLVATHDPEFVAAFAERVVLLADGAPIADGPTAEVLSGGTYFATETARILGGAGHALTPEAGIALLSRQRGGGMSWQLGAFTILGVAIIAGFAWYERSRPDARIVALVATLAAFAALGRIAFAALPNVKPTTDIVLISGYALGGAPGFVVGALDRADVELLLRAGTVDAVADGRVGRDRSARRRARDRHSRTDPPLAAGARLRASSATRSRRSRTSATGSPTATTAPRSWASTSARGPALTRSTPAAACCSRSRSGRR